MDVEIHRLHTETEQQLLPMGGNAIRVVMEHKVTLSGKPKSMAIQRAHKTWHGIERKQQMLPCEPFALVVDTAHSKAGRSCKTGMSIYGKFTHQPRRYFQTMRCLFHRLIVSSCLLTSSPLLYLSGHIYIQMSIVVKFASCSEIGVLEFTCSDNCQSVSGYQKESDNLRNTVLVNNLKASEVIH